MCNLPRDHRPSECQPDTAARLAARRRELAQLLGDHSLAECGACEAYLARVHAGDPPAKVIELRCHWAAQIQRELFPGEFDR